MADGNDGQVFGDHMGLFTLRFRALGPLLPKGCTMGAGNTPGELHPKRPGSSDGRPTRPVNAKTPDGRFQPVRRSRTRPLQGRWGLGAKPPGDYAPTSRPAR